MQLINVMKEKLDLGKQPENARLMDPGQMCFQHAVILLNKMFQPCRISFTGLSLSYKKSTLQSEFNSKFPSELAVDGGEKN